RSGKGLTDVSSLITRSSRLDDSREDAVETQQGYQRHHEQNDPRRAMQVSLPGLVAEVVGDQYQNENPNNVGNKGNRQNTSQHNEVVQPTGACHHVDEKHTQGGKAEHGIKPRA